MRLHRSYIRNYSPKSRRHKIWFLSSRPVMLGICGGIASGKSTLSHCLKYDFVYKTGRIFDADRVVRNYVSQQPKELLQLLSLNSKVTDEALRNILRRKAEENSEWLTSLESLLHPYVMRKARVFLKRSIRQRQRWIIWDVPLLWEKEYASFCHKIFFLHSSRSSYFARMRMSQQLYSRLSERQYSKVKLAKLSDMSLRGTHSRAAFSYQWRRVLTQLGLMRGYKISQNDTGRYQGVS